MIRQLTTGIHRQHLTKFEFCCGFVVMQRMFLVHLQQPCSSVDQDQ
jgi:hypothetical protein